jgi:hypothetical protein
MERLGVIKNHLLVPARRQPKVTSQHCSFDSSPDCVQLRQDLQKVFLIN